MKKILLLCLTLVFLVACQGEVKQEKIKIALVGQDQVSSWERVIEKAEKEGIEAELVLFNDYTQPNRALHYAEVDMNAFQHYHFLENEVEENNYEIEAISETFYFPLGIYSQNIKELDELKKGARIVIPNDPSNGSRALKLLADENLIKLTENEVLYDLESIEENPYELEIIEMDAATIPSSLDDSDLSVINAGIAVDNDLNPLEDALVLESLDEENHAYVNVIVVRSEDSEEEKFKRIVELYHEKDVFEIVQEETSGAAMLLP